MASIARDGEGIAENQATPAQALIGPEELRLPPGTEVIHGGSVKIFRLRQDEIDSDLDCAHGLRNWPHLVEILEILWLRPASTFRLDWSL
jgi:hypothetical protein